MRRSEQLTRSLLVRLLPQSCFLMSSLSNHLTRLLKDLYPSYSGMDVSSHSIITDFGYATLSCSVTKHVSFISFVVRILTENQLSNGIIHSHAYFNRCEGGFFK